MDLANLSVDPLNPLQPIYDFSIEINNPKPISEKFSRELQLKEQNIFDVLQLEESAKPFLPSENTKSEKPQEELKEKNELNPENSYLNDIFYKNNFRADEHLTVKNNSLLTTKPFHQNTLDNPPSIETLLYESTKIL